MSDIERYREGRVSEGVGETERVNSEGGAGREREKGGGRREAKRQKEKETVSVYLPLCKIEHPGMGTISTTT